MQAIVLFLLKRFGTEMILQLLKELIRILESRLDNNIDKDDVDAIHTRLDTAKDVSIKPTLKVTTE